MSKWIESVVDEHGNEHIEETIADSDACYYMYNEVCCNENSQFFGECLFENTCKMCSLFESEKVVQEKVMGKNHEEEEYLPN